ncbi:MAG: sigma-70 family RNA polymerase sigma factor [Sphingomonadales bacterium]|nr:MAG: sigma-70 family RNA polymerase sigma factor [Sphingomonadales bacterium]
MTEGTAPNSDLHLSADRILAACYDDMRRVARAIISGDRMNHVLQATDLANEAAIRLIRANVQHVEDQGHMLALAARTMRRILIDEVRRQRAAKRSAPPALTLWPDAEQNMLIDIEDLDRALEALNSFSEDHARIVELRFSMGLTVEETSIATGIPERTVKRRWQAARAWLKDYLNGEPATHLG